MKKLILLAAVALVAVASQAASFKFGTMNQYAYPSGAATKYSGSVTIFCSEMSDWSMTGTVANGIMDATKSYNQFTSDKFKTGENYTFYYVVTDGSYMYTSNSKSVMAQATDIVQVSFGNQASASSNKSNWTQVPEPTSAMLLLLGVAGLALKRKQK